MFRELIILCIVSCSISVPLDVSLVFNNLNGFYPGYESNDNNHFCSQFFRSNNSCFGGASKLASKVSNIKMQITINARENIKLIFANFNNVRIILIQIEKFN